MPPFRGKLTVLQDLIRTAPTAPATAQAVEEARRSIDQALAVLPEWERRDPAFVATVIRELLNTAASEYEAAITDGRIAETVEYQDSRGFVLYAEQLFRGIAPQLAAGDPALERKLATTFAALKPAWPDPLPPKSPSAHGSGGAATDGRPLREAALSHSLLDQSSNRAKRRAEISLFHQTAASVRMILALNEGRSPLCQPLLPPMSQTPPAFVTHPMVSPAAARRRASLAPLAATLLLGPIAAGATELNLEGMNRYAVAAGLESQEQVTSIDQFPDVRPTDWAYQALSNLIERYGCVAGYPDGTYQGRPGHDPLRSGGPAQRLSRSDHRDHRRAQASDQGVRKGTRRPPRPR